MRYRLIFTLAVVTVLGLAACDKDKEAGCEQLAAAVRDNDEATVQQLFGQLLASLPGKQHTAENLEALVAAINRECKVTATLGCFQCIKTLPPISEITVTVQGTARTIDISSSSSGNMICGHMH